MRPFRVGDKFKGNHVGYNAEVTWVDPQDRRRATISIKDLPDETVFAAQFLNHWTLIEEGPAAAA